MEITPILKQFGLNDKEIRVYLVLLETGPISVRSLADKSGINRGTTYDILKSLKNLGLASFYHKDTKQFFAAEDPEKLKNALEQKRQTLSEVESNLNKIIPELKSLYQQAGQKPAVKYYEGLSGIKTILSDVLETAAQATEKIYHVFSSSTIRPYLHQAWPAFTNQRIRNKIRVRVIAIGHSGTPAELSERKSLTTQEGSPTYILIYPGKVAMISINQEKKPLGLIIEDQAIFATHQQLFEYIWRSLS